MGIYSASFHNFFGKNILLVQGFDGEVKVYQVNDGFFLIYEIYGYKRKNPPKQGMMAPQLGAAFLNTIAGMDTIILLYVVNYTGKFSIYKIDISGAQPQAMAGGIMG